MSYQDVSGDPNRPGVQPGSVAPSTTATDTAKDQVAEVATTAREQASAVTGTVVASGQQVAAEAKEQVRHVTSEARDQLRSLVQQSLDELKDQAATRTAKTAETVRMLSEQLLALAEGRTEKAGKLAGYAGQAAERAEQYASRLEHGGFDTVVSDVQRFGRRRPGLFLLGAAAAGFAVGRLVRGAQAVSGESGDAKTNGAGPPSAAVSTSDPAPLAALHPSPITPGVPVVEGTPAADVEDPLPGYGAGIVSPEGGMVGEL